MRWKSHNIKLTTLNWTSQHAWDIHSAVDSQPLASSETFSSSQTESSCPESNSLSPLPKPLATTDLWICLLDISYKCNHTIGDLHDWLLSLSRINQHFFPFWGWIIVHCMGWSCLVYPSIHCLNCFSIWFLWLVLLWTCVYRHLFEFVSNYFGHTLRTGIAGSHGNSVFTFILFFPLKILKPSWFII